LARLTSSGWLKKSGLSVSKIHVELNSPRASLERLETRMACIPEVLGTRPAKRGVRKINKMLLYAGLMLVPVVLFALMLVLAKR